MDTKSTHSIDQEEELEETLSFCDLSLENRDLDDQFLTSHHSPNSPSRDHEFFEFPFISNTHLKKKNGDGIVFCGKLIKERDFVNDHDGGGGGGQSGRLFPLFSTKQLKSNENNLGSFYLVDSKSNSSSSTKSFRSQRCSSYRKHKVLIGLMKIPSKMELSDLKKRQSRRNQPLPMISPVATDDGCCAGGKRWHIWSLLRHLKLQNS